MDLAAGTRLGPYEVVSPIGAGGMGEVYRARDTRLERCVALKILPAHFSCTPELKNRFERETRTLSSVAHPHICHLYDVGSQSGTASATRTQLCSSLSVSFYCIPHSDHVRRRVRVSQVNPGSSLKAARPPSEADHESA